MEQYCRCLSVVIPAYNEGSRLGPTLDRILSYLKSWDGTWELIVVDDGSTDDTVAVAQQRRNPELKVVSLGRNRGKGCAARRGVLESRGCLILITDADLSTPIEDLDLLCRELPRATLVIGSRDLPESNLVVPQSFLRRLSGKVFRTAVALAGVRGVRDSQCGFKLIQGGVGRAAFEAMITEGFAFDVELIWLVQRVGLVVSEVPVTWADSQGSRVNMLFDPWRMLMEMVRFRIRHRSGNQQLASSVELALHDLDR